MKKDGQKKIYSPSDLITFFNSPFASWMDRYCLEYPDKIKPDDLSTQARFIIDLGNKHEKDVLQEIEDKSLNVVKIDIKDKEAREKTRAAVLNKTSVIYQAYLEYENFVGFADFIMLNEDGNYQVWDTKLAFSLKPTYVIQLCYYYEALKNMVDFPLSNKIGVIFGSKEKEEYRLEDFFYFYLHLKEEFMKMQDCFTGNLDDRPEPLRRADHGRWDSSAQDFFVKTDHLTRIARISNSQIKALKESKITTVREVANIQDKTKIKIDESKLENIILQAKLQVETEDKRKKDPLATPCYVILKNENETKRKGLGLLPEAVKEDVFFDMEGYPLVHGGLEYLFGASVKNEETGNLDFYDWWAHSREEEKIALENFIDWVYERWQKNRKMHIYHYAPYEVTAMRKLSTRHNTRQDEVDDLLRNEVFVDLYRVIKEGVMIGTESYSIKDVELLYRQKRDTSVSSGSDSIVQYAQWIASGEPKDPRNSKILSEIRDYNKDDCDSTAELVDFLRKIAKENNIETGGSCNKNEEEVKEVELTEEVKERKELEELLYQKNDATSLFLADIIDFHRREEKTKWWRLFDLAESTEDELYDDMDCIAKVKIVGNSSPFKRSYLQEYYFNPKQECKISNGNKKQMMFSDNLKIKFEIFDINLSAGKLILKLSQKKLEEELGGAFPEYGSLIPYESISPKEMQNALVDISRKYLEGEINKTTLSIINREKIENVGKLSDINGCEKLLKIVDVMNNKCVIVQGPPGTGKTYTASHAIAYLLKKGKKIGISSNSHKAIDNLLEAVAFVLKEDGIKLEGVRVSGEENHSKVVGEDSSFVFLKNSSLAKEKYKGGVVTGTSWLFSRFEWRDELDFLFIDEAGQVALANVIAVSPCAKNIILLGDQMQLKQPIQGSHPGDAMLSGLQYALKDNVRSTPDNPVFHPVVPDDYGIFLNESRRMHPNICNFISESIYEGKLSFYKDCVNQKISLDKNNINIINKENGIIFINIKHSSNTRKSEEEAEKAVQIYEELLGKPYTSFDKKTRPLTLEDFLFIAPYNAQVNLFKEKLPKGARVGTIDKFQGQQAPVCVLSLCMSYGEQRERGLSFILDKNRINVAISRTQCLAIVLGDKRIANNYTKTVDDIKQINLFCKLINN